MHVCIINSIRLPSSLWRLGSLAHITPDVSWHDCSDMVRVPGHIRTHMELTVTVPVTTIDATSDAAKQLLLQQHQQHDTAKLTTYHHRRRHHDRHRTLQSRRLLLLPLPLPLSLHISIAALFAPRILCRNVGRQVVRAPRILPSELGQRAPEHVTPTGSSMLCRPALQCKSDRLLRQALPHLIAYIQTLLSTLTYDMISMQ